MLLDQFKKNNLYFPIHTILDKGFHFNGGNHDFINISLGKSWLPIYFHQSHQIGPLRNTFSVVLSAPDHAYYGKRDSCLGFFCLWIATQITMYPSQNSLMHCASLVLNHKVTQWFALLKIFFLCIYIFKQYATAWT